MALVIDLKPSEKILIGNAVITNDQQRTRLHIEGDAPIMREKDVLKVEDVNTPCKRVYYIIQVMYLARNPKEHHDAYFGLVQEVQKAAPSTAFLIAEVNESIMAGSYYKALKAAKKLIKYEEELIGNATGK